MNKVTVKIEGMMCGMCESHIRDTIRKVFPNAKKVKASRTRKEASFLIEEPADAAKLEKAITDTGYTFLSVESEAFVKRGFFK
jgi:copper chaperone CopZ